MLELRPACECCAGPLPADSTGAMICSFECTFCVRCARKRFAGRCPNCAGDLTARPRRVGAMLHRYPAATADASPRPGPCEAN